MNDATENTAQPNPEIESIKGVLNVLFAAGDVIELRVLGTRYKTVSGYFNDVDALAHAAMEWNGQAPAIYVTLNPVDPALLARSVNRVTQWAKDTTGDKHILSRRWLPLDIDPVRPSGISSTEQEHDHAIETAKKVARFLVDSGIPADSIILGGSGNGAHVLVRIDLPNDKESTELVQRCIEAVALRFSDDRVSVDLTVHNAARIWKLYGTQACKGDNTAERPHRTAKLLWTCQRGVKIAPRVTLEKLASLAPEKLQANSNGFSHGFSLDNWITERLPDAIGPHGWNGGRKWLLDVCPWNPDHTNRSAYIVQHAAGGIGAGCHHNGCVGKRWRDLRDTLEPGWQARGTQATDTPFPLSAPYSVGKVGKQENPIKYPLFSSTSLLPQEGEETEDWLIPDLIAKETVNMLVAPPGNFKTYFSMHLSRCVAQGELFLGRAVEAARIIYIDKENPRGVIKKRMKQIGASLNYDVWPLWAMPEPPMLGNKAYLDLAVKDSLIIFDSMRRFHAGSENAPEEMAVVMKHLRDLTAQGATVLVLHHSGKAEGNAYRGSTENLAGIDAAFSLEKTNQPRTIGGPVSLSLRCLKHRIIEEQTWDIEFEVLPDGHAIFTDVTAAHRAEAEETRQETFNQVAAIIHELQNGELPNQTKILTTLKEKMGMGKNRALKILGAGEGFFWASKPENGSRQYQKAFPLSPFSHTIGVGKGEKVETPADDDRENWTIVPR